MDIVERLRIADMAYHPLNFDAANEIESLRAELEAVKKGRDELAEVMNYRCGRYAEELAAVTKERDELVSRIREFVDYCNEHERGWYSDGVAGLAVALAKVGKGELT